MNEELKETVLKVAEYSNEASKKTTRMVLVYFALGIVALIVNQVIVVSDLPDTFWVGFWEGLTSGMAFAAMIMGILYVTGTLNNICAAKRRMLGKE